MGRGMMDRERDDVIVGVWAVSVLAGLMGTTDETRREAVVVAAVTAYDAGYEDGFYEGEACGANNAAF